MNEFYDQPKGQGAIGALLDNELQNVGRFLHNKTKPIGSMYDIFIHNYHKNQPYVGKFYQSHGSYGHKKCNKTNIRNRLDGRGGFHKSKFVK